MEFKILEEAFSNLSDIERGHLRFTPVFGYGSKKDLMKYLRLERKQGETYYPLVWLMTPLKVEGDFFKTGNSKVEVDLILATLTNRDISNQERVRLTFEKTLEPLLEDVVKQLRFGNQVGIYENERFEIEKFFNYDTDGSNAVSDVWDAITLRCITKIKYC